MTLFTWTAESRSFLSNETRIQQFDFERVAKAVRDRFSHLSCEVSPDQCRLAFAEDITSTLPPDVLRETSMLNIDDSTSFDQVMNIVEIRNERNELRKKKTFDRILASLGPMTVSIVTGSDEHNLIKSNVAEKRMQEEHERCRKNEITAKKNEISRVEIEREILRQRRLAPTSESLDEGMPQDTSMPIHFDAESDLKYIDNAEDYSFSDYTDDMDNNYDYDLAGLVMDEDLDAVLEEVEKDIDLQAEAKGQTRNMSERSELYEVLALLERSSISKEKEVEYVKKTKQLMTIDYNDDEDNHNNDYNDNDQSNHYSRNDVSNRNSNSNTVKPPRISSLSAPVIAHKSSYLPIKSNNSSVDAIGGEEQEQELSLPSDEAVGHLGPKGVCAEQYLKIENRDSEKLIKTSDELERLCTSSSRSSTMIQSVKEIEHEEVRDALCVCDSDGDGDGDSDSDGEDSQGSGDWVDSRISLKMKALLYQSPPVPPSVPSDVTSPEIGAMYATTALAMPERESTTVVEVEVIVGRIQINPQSADQHSSGVARAASTPFSTISTPIPIEIYKMPLQDCDGTLPLPCDQRSSLAASTLRPTTPTSDPSRTYNVYDGIDLQDGEINEEKRPQLKMSGSLLGRRSGSRSVAALRTLRPPGVVAPVPLA